MLFPNRVVVSICFVCVVIIGLLALHASIAVTSDRIRDVTVQSSAETISQNLISGYPVVMLIPLNGFPEDENDPSVLNAMVARDVLLSIDVQDRYLILSEGNAFSPCISGAEQTASYLNLRQGYNPEWDVTVLFEEQATTTVENIRFAEPLILSINSSRGSQLTNVIIAGLSDAIAIPFITGTSEGLEIGHGGRAYLLAQQQLGSRDDISLVGFLPTNRIEPVIQGYNRIYNIQTWILAVTRMLYLPIFDRPEMKSDECPE